MTTGSPVWFTTDIELAESANTLFFDLEFISDLGAEGLLVAYLNDAPIGFIDERLALTGLNSYEFYLGELAPGTHTLGFRLDPYTEIDSSVVIADIEFGQATVVAVPEPSTYVMAAMGLVGLGFVARRRRKRP